MAMPAARQCSQDTPPKTGMEFSRRGFLREAWTLAERPDTRMAAIEALRRIKNPIWEAAAGQLARSTESAP
jgi:hypothetical protein